ncbi:related to dis1-suppressing protein kinase dsk1 [Fusarium proliferatum]|nr:related to dis1-suppressing protein kinase dsk1 [Fusarium proliferatum]
MTRVRPLMALYQQPWPISSAVAPRLDPSIPVEEEKIPNYHADRFYPIHLGQVLNGRYQIATKLGYGANSTVWLARDLNRWRWSPEKYVAVKVNATNQRSRRSKGNELDIMRHISQVNPKHKGWHFIRKLSDSFELQGTLETHSCLVLEALREPLWLYQTRYIGSVIPPDILKILVQMILHALDYLHSECRIVHTDLKPDNIMVKIEDPSIFERDAQDEFDNPLPQKHIDERTIIYLSRNNYGPLSVPTGTIQIVDFDLSVRAEPGQVHTGAIQGEIYRAPEVILNAGYTYSADIWSLGVMLWDLLEGKSLFNPTAPGNADEYDDQSHLGQISALIGPPPQSLLSSGQRTSMFYKPNGEIKNPGLVPAPGDFSFENTISCMSGEEKVRYIRFIKRMVKWSPEERSTARELLDDPWLYEDFPQD